MTNRFPFTARGVALQALIGVRDSHRFAHDILDQQFSRLTLTPPDRRLATHLANGVLRRRATLDALARPFIDRPGNQVEPWLMEALRLGVFQIALMTQIPPHAALNETVELAAEYGLPRAKGFLNGVLRRVVELVTDDVLDAPAANALPTEEGHYRRLAQEVLPDPAEKPADYLSIGMSWPRWLADRWLSRYSWDECLRLGFWFAGPAPLWLRVNSLRTDRNSFLNRLAEAGIDAVAGEMPQSVRLLSSASVRDLPGYVDGHFAVQDQSAMRVSEALSPLPGMTVLDICAAPGGKTTHMAELMQNRGQIFAFDADTDRLATLNLLSCRLGHTIIQPIAIKVPPAGPFDAVLADVPCSNTGVLGRRPEVRWRVQQKDFRYLVPLQTKLLRAAFDRVMSGGVVVYSTCSIEPEENEKVVRACLQANPECELEAENISVPGRPADGGYWARMRRR